MFFQELAFPMPSVFGELRVRVDSLARAGLGAVEWHQRLYVIGGNDAQGQYSTDALSARFDMGLP